MIQLAGSIKRTFVFPANLNTAQLFYSQLHHIIQFMPHINLVETYDTHKIRVMYKTKELGAYTIRVFCDLESFIEPDTQILHLVPLTTYPPIEAKAAAASTTGQGVFSLQAQFFNMNDQKTRIEYQLQLEASLYRPLGMRLMPKRIVNRIAKNITNSRIREIADGFIQTSIAAYPEWLLENQPIQ